MNNDLANELLTVKEVSRKLKVSESTLSRWRKTGVMPFVKVGDSVRYKESDIENLLKTK